MSKNKYLGNRWISRRNHPIVDETGTSRRELEWERPRESRAEHIEKRHYSSSCEPNSNNGQTSSEITVEHSTSRAVVTQASARDTHKHPRYRYEFIQTRPLDITSKSGTLGKTIALQTNYLRLLTTPEWYIYKYHVSFEPQVELERVRYSILSENSSVLGAFLYDDAQLFTINKLAYEKTVLNVVSKNEMDYAITIRYVGVISMPKSQLFQILGMIMRCSMKGLNMQLVARNFVDAASKIDFGEFVLELYRAYLTCLRQHEKVILLSPQITHKVKRINNLYDILSRCIETCTDYQEEFRRQVLDLMIVTYYNNKTYKIKDVDFNQNPNNTFTMKGKEISFIDYYYQNYNIRIRENAQPLLISKSKDHQVRGGQDELIMLVPELCCATGNTNTLHSHMNLMRASINSNQRIERLRMFNKRLQNTPAISKVLTDWNMVLDKNLIELTGRVLEPQKIMFSDQVKLYSSDQAEWSQMFCNRGLFSAASQGLRRWFIITINRNQEDMNKFIDTLIHVAKGMRMTIERPQQVTIYNYRSATYIKALEECYANDPQLVMVLVPNNNARMIEKYASIKRKCCLDRAVPTQVIMQRNITNPRSLIRIATSVAIQMNCKLGYTPRMIDFPLSDLMAIGYSVARSTRDCSKTYGALVASIDLKVNTTFYSTVSECSAHDVVTNSLWPMMMKALRQYRTEHDGKLPAHIIFYHDGVGEVSLQQLYENEVKNIVEQLQTEYRNDQNQQPLMFAYVVVTKSINTRFFSGRCNLPPQCYDFFLTSQSMCHATIAPTCYNVIYSNNCLKPDQMQLLTYRISHLHYNWSGSTNVPVVCQYAKKLATLVATCLYKPPLEALNRNLFYL